MTFSPQYGYWGLEDFSSSDGFVFSDPTAIQVVDGVLTLVPSYYTGSIQTYNTIWDPVTSWTVDNNMDTTSGISGDFTIVAGTGYNSDQVGTYGNSGDTAQLAFYTHTNAPVTGSNGAYVSGSFACLAWNGTNFTTNQFNRLTIECSVRTIADEVTHDLYSAPSSGLACHGIFIGTTVGSTFVEVHPAGLKIHGVSGAILPGDYSSSARRIRIVRSTSAILLMADDGHSLYVPTGLIPGTNGTKYITFGAFPVKPENYTFTGLNAGFAIPSQFFDPYGLTGLAGFEGTTLWDDVNIKADESSSVANSGVSYTWPSTVQTAYTPPWYPNKSINRYLGVAVDSITVGNGTATITPQYLASSGTTGGSSWTDFSSTLTVTTDHDSNSLDLTNIPVYNGIDNALRFKIQLSGNGTGPTPQIDTITAIAQAKDDYVDVIPNWKLSALPKEIYFAVDRQKYKEVIPPAHYQDDIYLHNESNVSLYSTGQYILGGSFNLASGQVISTNNGVGIAAVPDGIYGPALRNFPYYTGMAGVLYSNSFREINTGIFVGNLNNAFDIYPQVASLPTTATGSASCVYSVDQFVNAAGEFVTAQTVSLQNWIDTAPATIGLTVTGVGGPNIQGLINIYEGVIQIPRGPGVRASIKNEYATFDYYLNGNNYRTPKAFSCAALFTGISTGTSLILGFDARPSQPGVLDPARWGSWADELNYHNRDEFTLFALTGYTAKHSYVQYVSSGNITRTSPLNPSNTSYPPVSRNSVLFEGWVRPYGITGTASEALIFSDIASNNRGLNLYLDRTGNVRATIELDASVGVFTTKVANGFQPVYLSANRTVHTGSTGLIDVNSNGCAINFGDWNHIGLYQDVRALGDTYTKLDQPAVIGTTATHGARTARLYLELNGRIVHSMDIGVDSYSNNIVNGLSISAWPRMPTYAGTGLFRTGLIGKDILADFDHVRFGIHNTVDAKTWSTVYGNRETAPSFVPWNAVKVPVPVSGSPETRQYAHIYRFDHPTSYQAWDDGFAINHAYLPNYNGIASELSSRGIKNADFFIQRVSDGPKGREALRLGPGAHAVIPWSSYDERVFNGSGSCSLTFGSSVANSGAYYANSGTYLHSNMGTWLTGAADVASASSNSRVAFGGKFRLHNYPTGLMYGDLMNFEESAATGNYGIASIYIAVNNTGSIIYGTRRTSASSIWDGSTNQYVVGPFTGSKLELETWYPVFLDAQLALGPGYLRLYTGDVLASSTNVTLTDAGALSPYTGRAIGYHGLLGTRTGTILDKSSFSIGGEPPRDSIQRTYQYMDMDVSECMIMFPFSGLQLDLTDWAYTGDLVIDGHTDKSFKNTSTKIAPVYGTGIGQNAFYYGRTLYPATSFSDAGEHLFWSTANAGNDFENLNDFGVKIYDEAIFNNAESYYVVYEDNATTQAFGTIDSPIQLVPRVPPEGVNLALLTNKEWSSDYAVSTFDLSDQNYSNITNLNGNNTIPQLVQLSTTSGVFSSGYVSSDNIRLSSFPVYDVNSSNSYVGYFAHLIGGGSKGVYIPSAYTHQQASVDYSLYHLNLDKIQKLITITDANGNQLSFDEFPYSLIVTPYSPDADIGQLGANVLGYGSLTAGELNPDSVFTCILVATHQSIDKSVFVHYPSKVYDGTVINLQDSDVYNPIPLMKKIPFDGVHPTGSFSVTAGNAIKGYNITIWNASISGWV